MPTRADHAASRGAWHPASSGGDFIFEADKLALKKGAALTLKVELPLQGEVQVARRPGARDSGHPPVAPPLAKAPFDARQARDHQEAWAKYSRRAGRDHQRRSA